MMKTRLSASRGFLALAGLIGSCGMVVMGGCRAEGGWMYSDDSPVYASTTWQPKTITLKDTRTGQDVWSLDIPVGKKVVMKFSDTGGTKDDYTPAQLTWGLIDDDGYMVGFESLKNTLSVPPASARRLDVSLRAVPEFPESMVRVTRGAVQPAKPALVREPEVTIPRSKPLEPELIMPGTSSNLPGQAPAQPAPQPGVVLPPGPGAPGSAPRSPVMPEVPKPGATPAAPTTPATPITEPPIDLPK